jgi:hypothetical protein
MMRRLGMKFCEDTVAHGMPSVRYVGTASSFRAIRTTYGGFLWALGRRRHILN